MYEGTDQVFDGRTLNELIDELTRAAPAAAALSQVAPAYDRLASVLDQMHARFRAAANAAAAGHRGPAAQASQEHAARQATFAVDGTTEAGTANGSVSAQSQHYSDTVARMPGPAEEPALWRVITVPLDPTHTYIVEKAQYDAGRQAAVDAMNTYQVASNDTVQKFALFTEPRVTPVGLSDAGGQGAPGFPGGGSGASPGAHATTAGAGSVGGGGGSPGSTTPGGGGIPVVPQGVPAPTGTGIPSGGVNTRGSVPTRPGTGSPTTAATPSLTPLRPRPGVPGAWDGSGGSGARAAGARPGSGGALSSGARPGFSDAPGPGARPGSGEAGAAGGRATPAAGRAGNSGNPYLPMGAGAGGRRGDQERRRPPWLLEDDPDAAFGPMPPHAPPVIEATDDRDPR